jgi:hypothetical protein
MAPLKWDLTVFASMAESSYLQKADQRLVSQESVSGAFLP